jgi:hypothetical protein
MSQTKPSFSDKLTKPARASCSPDGGIRGLITSIRGDRTQARNASTGDDFVLADYSITLPAPALARSSAIRLTLGMRVDTVIKFYSKR